MNISTGRSSKTINMNVLYGSMLALNLGNATVSETGYGIDYSISCPTSFFNTSEDYLDLCLFNDSVSGLFEMDTS